MISYCLVIPCGLYNFFIFGTVVFVLVRLSKYFCYFTRCFIGGRCPSLLSSSFELLWNLLILILSMHVRRFSFVRCRDWVFFSCSSWFLIASGHRIPCFTIFSAHLYPVNVLEPEVLEYSFSLQMKVSLLYQLFDLCVQASEGNFFL